MGAGGSKAFVQLPSGVTFLESIARTCAEGGVERIALVLGEKRPEGARVPEPIEVLINPEPARGMLSSLWIALDSPCLSEARGLLLWPVDCPRVPASLVRELLAVARGGAVLAVPSHDNRRGHPAYFARKLFPELRRADPRVGARSVVRRHESSIIYVSSAEPTVLEDLDRPGDLGGSG
jgi:CTP:molybdopterin cytidylyltransferase MocA